MIYVSHIFIIFFSVNPVVCSDCFCVCFFQGILDIIVLSEGYTKNDFAIHTLKNNFEADAYFVKVIGKYLFYVFFLSINFVFSLSTHIFQRVRTCSHVTCVQISNAEGRLQ